jgi:hypothetical protein
MVIAPMMTKTALIICNVFSISLKIFGISNIPQAYVKKNENNEIILKVSMLAGFAG